MLSTSMLLHTRINVVLSALTLAGTVVLLYMAFFSSVSPMRSQRIVAVEGIGIGATAQFIITRELCHARDNEAEAHRAFHRFDDDAEQPEEVHPLPEMLLHFQAGCHTASRRIPLPDDLRPGRYVYTASLEWCNDLIRCEVRRLSDVGVTIVGDSSHRLVRPYELVR
jgi:hypothetical protein